MTADTNSNNNLTVTAQTYNHDVFGLVNRLFRFVDELSKAASSNVPDVLQADQNRFLSYIQAARNFIGWVESAPQLDLPKSYLQIYTIDYPQPVVPDLENESVKDLVIMFQMMIREISDSQSSRLPSGLNKYDSNRVKGLLDKSELFIKNYIQTTDPIDLPETSPTFAVAPAGKQGI